MQINYNLRPKITIFEKNLDYMVNEDGSDNFDELELNSKYLMTLDMLKHHIQFAYSYQDFYVGWFETPKNKKLTASQSNANANAEYSVECVLFPKKYGIMKIMVVEIEAIGQNYKLNDRLNTFYKHVLNCENIVIKQNF